MAGVPSPPNPDPPPPDAIAVVGLACRFPGARDPEMFWRNLAEGRESITIFDAEELEAAGVPAELYRRPEYVPARAVVDDAECFDAGFFGYTPREAETMDPQHRLFLECGWAACEDAGWNPEGSGRTFGLFAGSSSSDYARRALDRPDADPFTAGMSAPDFLVTRVAYAFDLRGPAVSVQTACSTSLVAVHMACQALLGAECDVALAGGVSVKTPLRAGYLYQRGGILSPDGHCRAFDARAAGTVPGSGVGVVVLKRLEDALADGDTVRAVIRGSAINNDGSAKVGYTAPSVEGQAQVIAEALGVAEVAPESVSYVEAHGTATEIGDPTEVAALRRALEGDGGRALPCALGSVKTNFGHLDAAAGVAGLIKTVLALERRMLPPSLHFETPHPRIDFGPRLHVCSALREWETEGVPRRAGVSSFGIGGTNAHVVLEEAPPAPEPEASRSWHVFPLSARTPAALERLEHRLAEHLENRPEASPADVARTLQVGRRAFEHRRAVVARSLDGAARALRADEGPRTRGAAVRPGGTPAVFLFPGQESRLAGAGRELYAEEPVFREEIDRGVEVLERDLDLGRDLDVRRMLLADDTGDPAGGDPPRPEVFQPALFLFEHALARLWMAQGVDPEWMLGHSLGEYVAACLAEVFSPEDALALLVARGRLMQELPRGAMSAVALPEAEVEPALSDGVSLAAVNGPRSCVVSGPVAAVEGLERRWKEQGIAHRRLPTAHAFHSEMVAPVLEPFRDRVARVPLAAPTRPVLSSVTGRELRAEEARDPEHWVRQIRATVRFGAALDRLLEEDESHPVFVEVGPGRSLSGLVRRRDGGRRAAVLASAGAPRGGRSGHAAFLDAVAGAWVAGAPVDWRDRDAGGRTRRVPLPTYPFERERHWIEPRASGEPAGADAGPPEPPAPTGGAAGARQETRGRRERIRDDLVDLLASLLGVPAESIAPDADLLDLGVDSLLIMQLAQKIERRFGLEVPFRNLLEGLSSLPDLVAHLEAELPPDEPAVPHAAPAASSPPAEAPSAASVPEGGEASLETIVLEQLRMMSEQLELLRARDPRRAAAREGGGPDAFRPVAPEPPPRTAPPDGQTAFGPHRPLRERSRADVPLDAEQRRRLDAFVERYTRRTRSSKDAAAVHRGHLADSRASASFRRPWKELVYPIVAERSDGSRIWDLDGNEYVDFTMGFGVHLFGHSPPFVVDALREQLKRGLHIGPQSDRAGEVARLVSELTGLERVAFCNTGTEAVMGALRIARAVTGRDKIALFAGSYHGSFDGVLARPAGHPGATAGLPAAPGVPESMMEDLLVLDYGEPAALDAVRRHAGELAAVLVEPMQSRRPDFFPEDFLHELRALTRERDVPLIFDEIISGFRLHPAGAQGLLGLRADLATYGKVLAGGLPIGVVAGASRLMDAVDGGAWRYGDDSAPTALQTIFAGTFSKNPSVMAAARAVLTELHAQGPALQEDLTRRTESLATELEDLCARERVPIRIPRGGSLFRFDWRPEDRHLELLFCHLAERGVYVWEGRGCFLSTAHDRSDLDRLLDATARGVAALRRDGLLPARGGSAPATGPASGVRSETTRPLTPGQQNLWVHTQIDRSASLAYNEVLAFRVRGPLDRPALETAVRRLVERHEALRTTFSPQGDHQRIHPTLEVSLEEVGPPPEPIPEDPDERCARVLERALETPFDLERGPLLRALLHRLDEGDHLVALLVHHLVADGHSMGVLGRDLLTVYEAAASGRALEAPPPMQLGEWIDRHFGSPDGAERQRARALWLERLDGARPVALPPPRGRRPSDEAPAGRVSLRVGAEAMNGLASLRRRGRTTMPTLLTTVFLALLHRALDLPDLLVGVPSAGRTFRGDEELVAHCVELLPVRSRVDGDPTFLELLAASAGEILDAREHGAYAADAWAAPHGTGGAAARPPRIEALFNVESPAVDAGDGEVGARSVAGARITPVRPPVRHAKFGVALDAALGAAGLELTCVYDPDRVDETWARTLPERYGRALAAIVDNPGLRLSDLPVLSDEEREQVLARWNDTARAYPLERPLSDRLGEQAARTPEAIAVVCGDESLTYGELAARAGRLAERLRSRGVGPETLVGVCMERSLDLVVALLGVLRAGGAYVPLDPSHPPMRLRAMVEDGGIGIALVRADTEDRLADAGAELIASDEPRRRSSAPGAGPRTPAAALAYVIHTSGSTGKPKGVMNAHRGIVNRLLWMQDEYDARPGDSILHKTPFGFDVSVWELFWPLMVGARLVVARPGGHRDPGYLADLVAAERVTTMHFVPSLLKSFLEETDLRRRCRSLRRVICSGEALPPDVRDAFLEVVGCELHNLYGPTEAAVDVTHARCAVGERPVPLGGPVANTQVYVLDRRLQPVAPGVPGELFLGGTQVARGYLRDPKRTAERFVPDPWSEEDGGRLFRSGDRARWSPDGTLEFLGRLDEQVKIRGLRIEPSEIEAVLRRHPAVRDVAVIACEQGSEHAHLRAYVVGGDGGAEPSEAELRPFAADRLPEHMIPAHWIVLGELPLTRSGKLDRRALPEPRQERPRSGRSGDRGPRTALERTVRDAWCEVLGVDDVGLDESFFEVGGNSLLTVRVFRKLEPLAQDLSVTDLFAHPTVRSQAARLSGPPDAPGGSETTERRSASLSAGAQRLARLRAQRSPGGRSGSDRTED